MLPASSPPSSRRTSFLVPVRHGLAWLLASSVALVLAPPRVGSADDSPPPSAARALPLAPRSAAAPGFTRLDPVATGLLATNRLSGDARLTNAVAHNGSGVALGDIDGDGRPDVFLAVLEGPNRQYRNLGNGRFAELDPGPAACPDQLSSGVALADLDGDGDLDLLVNGIAAGTRLFLNDGRGAWTEARDTGLARATSPMSSALADIDGDGDLDLYCTHYANAVYLADPTLRLSFRNENGRPVVDRVNGQPADQPPWKDRFHAKPGGGVLELPERDALYRNDGGGRFTPIHDLPGTFADAVGRPAPPHRDWGLSAMFRDVNGDRAPDLYVANDSGSDDRFWINTGQGTFRAAPPATLGHASYSSMGVDFADLDHDGHDDFFVVDMLARDRARRLAQLSRSSASAQDPDQPDARPLFFRNMLFLGRPGGTFAETAFLAGVAATDWSWCPIFLDVDLDGHEDLIVSTGFDQDVLDQDTVDGFRTRRWTPDQVRRYRGHFPPWPTALAAFRNRGDATFEPRSSDWGFREPGVAHGMAAADLDGDGDLDLVVNQLNAPPAVYRNDASAPRVAVRLAGRAPNTQGIGARVRLVAPGLVQSQEFIAGGRYLSGDQPLRVFAVPAGDPASLRLEVTWRDGTLDVVQPVRADQLYEIRQGSSPATPAAIRTPPPTPDPFFADVSAWLGHRHQEQPFDDWARQPLLPRRLSRLGPGVGWTDVDGDGRDDLVVCAARGDSLAVFLKEPEREGFRPLPMGPPASADQVALVAWPSTSARRDLFVAGSNYALGPDAPSRISWYAHGSETRDLAAGPSAIGPLAAADADLDGDLDLFVGGRVQAGRYPEPVSSIVWRQAADGFETTEFFTQPFENLGLATSAVWDDLDLDGDPDLVVALEWGPIRVFRNLGGRFEDATAALGLADRPGLWNGVTTGDFDGDGRPDIAAGNWGRNSAYALHLPAESPRLRAHYGDWNGDGRYPVVEATFHGGAWRPILDRLHLDRALPDLQARFATHRAFAAATLDEILGPRAGSERHVEASEFESGLWLNRGTRFEWRPLPREAQWSPVFSLHAGDVDGDGNEDLFLTQNFFGYPPGSGLSREDAGTGLWLIGSGDGRFHALDAATSGIRLAGEQRGAALGDFNGDGRVDLAVGRNHEATALFVNRRARPGLVVIPRGPRGNPDAYGAQVRVIYSDGRRGPLRSIHGGSGSGSLDAATQVLGLAGTPRAVEIRWPGGATQTVDVAEGQRRVEARAPSR